MIRFSLAISEAGPAGHRGRRCRRVPPASCRLDRDFLPPFNEGAMQINVLLPPGTSLAKSNEVAARVEERLHEH